MPQRGPEAGSPYICYSHGSGVDSSFMPVSTVQIHNTMHFFAGSGIQPLKDTVYGKKPDKESDKKKKIRTGVSGALEGSRGNRPGGLLLV